MINCKFKFSFSRFCPADFDRFYRQMYKKNKTQLHSFKLNRKIFMIHFVGISVQKAISRFSRVFFSKVLTNIEFCNVFCFHKDKNCRLGYNSRLVLIWV